MKRSENKGRDVAKIRVSRQGRAWESSSVAFLMWRFQLAVWNKESAYQEIHMSGSPSRLKEVTLRLIRYCGFALDGMVPFLTSLMIALIIIQGNGMRLFVDSAALLVGTTLAVGCAIHSMMKLRVFKPLRAVVSQRFASWPPALGFSVIFFLVVTAILAEVVALRGFMAPANSWPLVTFGFLHGIMSRVMRGMERRSNRRGEEGSISNDLLPPAWIRYDPPDSQAERLISASHEAVGK